MIFYWNCTSILYIRDLNGGWVWGEFDTYSSFICDNKEIKLIWESKLVLELVLDRFLKQLCDIPISYNVY